jgi:hypothetical protein
VLLAITQSGFARNTILRQLVEAWAPAKSATAGKVGRKEKYVEGVTANSVLVRTVTTHPDVETLHYTDFNADGKIDRPEATELAKRAILSVTKAESGKDGVSYLDAAIHAGIETPLTKAYATAILFETQTESLLAALAKLTQQKPPYSASARCYP